MREIKFRAWDKKNKRMAKVYTLGLTGIDYSTIQSGGVLLSGCGKNDIELMQFTGISDKNGKEIYEGDIFGVYSLIGDFAGSHEPRGKVVFDNDLCAYVAEDVNGGWVYLSEYIEKPRYEVIGNIYENSELLEE